MAPVSTSFLPVLLGSIGVAALATPATRLAARDDFVCNPTNYNAGQETFSCYEEHSAMNIVGDAQTVSDVISCNTDNCMQAISQTYTTMQSFSFDIGVDGGVGKGEFTGSASAGVSWEWSNSQATSTTETFGLENGDVGHILFWPYLHQSCGALTVTYEYCQEGSGCVPNTPAQINDANACGTTALLLPDQNGQRAADGVFQFCYTAGAKNGQGCSNPPGPTR